MKVYIFADLAVVVAAALLILKKYGRSSGKNGPWLFYAKKPLTVPEQVLYHRLVTALPEHIVLAQVQVSRVLGVKKGFNFSEWNNRINRPSLRWRAPMCGGPINCSTDFIHAKRNH